MNKNFEKKQNCSGNLCAPQIPLGGAYIMDALTPALHALKQKLDGLPEKGDWSHIGSFLDSFTAGNTALDEIDVLNLVRCYVVICSYQAVGVGEVTAGARTESFGRAVIAAAKRSGYSPKIHLARRVKTENLLSRQEETVELDKELCLELFDCPEMYAVRDWVGRAYDCAFVPDSLGVGPAVFSKLGSSAVAIGLESVYEKINAVRASAEDAWLLAGALKSENCREARLMLAIDCNPNEIRYLTVAGGATAVLPDDTILPYEIVPAILEGRIKLEVLKSSAAGRLESKVEGTKKHVW